MKLTFIDFETANRERSSICSVGISVQENGIEVDSFYSLIKPAPFLIEPQNTKVHGLEYFDLVKAPKWTDVYEKLKPYLQGILVAHNASFDMSCLSRLLFKMQMEFPDFQYVDSLKVASYGQLPSKLSELNEFFGFDKYAEHNALEDARALGRVYWQLREKLSPEFCRRFLRNFKDRLNIEIERDTKDEFLFSNESQESKQSRCDLPFTVPQNIHFSGKGFIVTGNFTTARRSDIEEKIELLGGKLQAGASRNTDYIIIGEIASSGWKNGNYGNKIEEALEFKNSITFLREKDFCPLLYKKVEEYKKDPTKFYEEDSEQGCFPF